MGKASKLARLKRLLNPAPVTPHASVPRPDLLSFVKHESLTSGCRDGLLLALRDMLPDKAQLEPQQQEFAACLQNRQAVADLVVVFTAELVDAQQTSKHVLMPCSTISDDRDFKLFVTKYRGALSLQRELDATRDLPSKGVVATDPSEEVKHLPLPPVLQHEQQTELTPCISIYIGFSDNADKVMAYANSNLDRLSVAVGKLQRDSDKMPVPIDASPFWLSRLDATALQRYVRELTDGLCGSVEEAFESRPFLMT